MQLFMPDCQECGLSIVPLILLGISYSVYAVAQWGSLPYIVEARTLGTAFGIVNVFENIGTVLAPPILGLIQENTEKDHGYFWVEIFFTFIACLSLFFNILSMRPIAVEDLPDNGNSAYHRSGTMRFTALGGGSRVGSKMMILPTDGNYRMVTLPGAPSLHKFLS